MSDETIDQRDEASPAGRTAALLEPEPAPSAPAARSLLEQLLDEHPLERPASADLVLTPPHLPDPEPPRGWIAPRELPRKDPWARLRAVAEVERVSREAAERSLGGPPTGREIHTASFMRRVTLTTATRRATYLTDEELYQGLDIGPHETAEEVLARLEGRSLEDRSCLCGLPLSECVWRIGGESDGD